jgi:hypothetical protein
MRFLLPFMSLLSLTGANFLRHNMPGWSPSYNSSTYYWGCGTNTTAARSDCEHALNMAIHGPAFIKIQNNKLLAYWFSSCKVSVVTTDSYDPVSGPIQVDEFRDIANWGFGSLCDLGMQRTYFTPQNHTWYAYVTEATWNYGDNF